MPQIAIELIRLGFLALIWLFVFAALRVVRTDLFGARPGRRPGLPSTPPARRPGPPPPPPAAPKPARGRRQRSARSLLVTDGALAGTRITLGEAPITIGRANDSTLVLTDDYVSSRHARLTPRDGQWLVEDMGSTNGTYLDRSKVTGPTPVPFGTPIRIGKTVLELRS